ncbi:unnamed protein product [Heligmosomoides polygyrus]|uniref:Transposase n=1 Tax=Heligmosomoides polygyrus TaxID=6339 RepID=A0A183FW37_HELPZ|nr:unnamed protein product [Heligmosomoides polygyrus]
MLACNEGNGKSPQRYGDEDAALDGWSHAHGPHTNRCHSAEVRCRADCGQDKRAPLRRYGHVLRGKGDIVRKIGLALEVSGK